MSLALCIICGRSRCLLLFKVTRMRKSLLLLQTWVKKKRRKRIEDSETLTATAVTTRPPVPLTGTFSVTEAL